MLQSQWHSNMGTPIIFLHGLLGSQQDWQAVLQYLQSFPQIRPLTIDLPFHGKSEQTACRDFIHARMLLDQTIQHQIGKQPFYLVGYSLGGRLALDYALNSQNTWLRNTFLEGANVGLATEEERQLRWQNDQKWATRFHNDPIENVLTDWYQQKVFAHLDANKRSDLVEKRRVNNGKAIAKMLEATSLAKQPFYANKLSHMNQQITFFIGEQDQKFRTMAEQYQLNYRLIPQAGHNAHLENPAAFVRQLLTELNI